jgi:serpin B
MSCDICGIDNDEKISPRELSALEKEIVSSENLFGIKLFKALNDVKPDSNLFISPLSVSMALGMTLNGAADSTYEAMKNTLELQGLTEDEINQAYKDLIELLANLDEKVVMNIANSIWIEDNFPVLQPFIDVNKTYFGAEVESFDVADPNAVDIINGWVEYKTNGKIKKIIDVIPPNIALYLINAIYFNGTWAYEFDKKDTEDKPFYNFDNSTSTIPLMSMNATLPVLFTDSFSIVDIPYGDSLFSMTVILPNNKNDINTLAETVTNDNWNEWLGQLTVQELDLYLPKFKLEWDDNLKDVLTELGMGIAFDPDNADFTRINPQIPLWISRVIHKTFVEVNEEGTEAAAATVVEMVFESAGPAISIIRVDHPFIFAIREQHTGTILFMGKVLEL